MLGAQQELIPIVSELGVVSESHKYGYKIVSGDTQKSPQDCFGEEEEEICECYLPTLPHSPASFPIATGRSLQVGVDVSKLPPSSSKSLSCIRKANGSQDPKPVLTTLLTYETFTCIT